MAICDYCEEDMSHSVGCTTGTVDYPDGITLNSIPNTGTKCHDCYAPPYSFHHPGCDMERCPNCEGQLISCGCLDDEED